MTLTEETACIAAPGFAGFIPSFKYQFGLTYGNATRQILEHDHSLKQGKYQQEVGKRKEALRDKYKTQLSSSEGGGSEDGIGEERGRGEDRYVWRMKNKYATGDDRFSFPPVPGYTGYIPRCREHFGHPYVESTHTALTDFKTMVHANDQLPPRVKAVIRAGKQKEAGSPTSSVSSSSVEEATRSSKGGDLTVKIPSKPKPTYLYAATTGPVDDLSPYLAPAGHANKTRVSGYTGFVPRLQNHFGEPYSHSVRKAIDEFTAPHPQRTPTASTESTTSRKRPVEVNTRPIPGFTGFIPGSRYAFATTFGKTSEISYDAFNHRDERGRIPPNSSVPSSALGPGLPKKDLIANPPISGYRGHIPGKIFQV
ncbi:hypothetical protein HK102_000025 [Quaeritorhiza haematococci]|nr:hypothetical protein HK102_000025 [Quaeritorhiza haematococci]